MTESTPIARKRAPAWAVIGLLLAGTGLLSAEDLAARVVVLANSRQPESIALAEYYAEARGIPRANIVALPMPETESITWREYVDQVHQPLQDELVKRKWIEAAQSQLLDPMGRRRAAIHGHRISFLVACRGVPLRIHHDPTLAEPRVRVPGPQFRTTQAAVDAELALLARPNPPALGFVPNPLFGKAAPNALETAQVVRVARLDGPAWDDARRLVLSALEAEAGGIAGRYYLDFKGPHADGDKWLESARAQLEELGFDGESENTAGTLVASARFDAPLWYFGWYAADLNGPFANESFRFPPGAIALHIHSFSAATLRSRDSGWTGPLVARGVTATMGNVFEPYLQLTHRPDLLVRGLRAGKTLGEAAYEALPVLGWQAVVVGDPLYRPLGGSTAAREGGPHPLAPYEAIRAANLRRRADDVTGAVTILQTAMERTPGLPVMLALARALEAAGDGARAIQALELARHRREFRGDDWMIARDIARELARLQAPEPALQVYRVLADSPAPTVDDRRALLAEARTLADRNGDLARSLEFARRLNEAGAETP